MLTILPRTKATSDATKIGMVYSKIDLKEAKESVGRSGSQLEI
jgi:hypothetical protein